MALLCAVKPITCRRRCLRIALSCATVSGSLTGQYQLLRRLGLPIGAERHHFGARDTVSRHAVPEGNLYCVRSLAAIQACTGAIKRNCEQYCKSTSLHENNLPLSICRKYASLGLSLSNRRAQLLLSRGTAMDGANKVPARWFEYIVAHRGGELRSAVQHEEQSLSAIVARGRRYRVIVRPAA